MQAVYCDVVGGVSVREICDALARRNEVTCSSGYENSSLARFRVCLDSREWVVDVGVLGLRWLGVEARPVRCWLEIKFYGIIWEGEYDVTAGIGAMTNERGRANIAGKVDMSAKMDELFAEWGIVTFADLTRYHERDMLDKLLRAYRQDPGLSDPAAQARLDFVILRNSFVRNNVNFTGRRLQKPDINGYL